MAGRDGILVMRSELGLNIYLHLHVRIRGANMTGSIIVSSCLRSFGVYVVYIDCPCPHRRLDVHVAVTFGQTPRVRYDAEPRLS